MPNAQQVTQLVNNPAALSTMNSNPGAMGAIVAAMATQQQQQQLQQLSQVQQAPQQQVQSTNSLFSSPGSVAQQLSSSSFTTAQSAANPLTNGALTALPTNLTGMVCVKILSKFYIQREIEILFRVL